MSTSTSNATPTIRRNAGISFIMGSGSPAIVQAGPVQSKAPTTLPKGLEPVPLTAFAPRRNGIIPIGEGPIVLPSNPPPAAPKCRSHKRALTPESYAAGVPSSSSAAGNTAKPLTPPSIKALQPTPQPVAAPILATTSSTRKDDGHPAGHPANVPSHLAYSPARAPALAYSLHGEEASWAYIGWCHDYQSSLSARAADGMEWLTTDEYLLGEVVMDPRDG